MFRNIDPFLRGRENLDVDSEGEPSTHELCVAVVALLVETAKANREFVPEELQRVVGLMKATFGLSDEEVANHMDVADFMAREHNGTQRFFDAVNEHFSAPQRVEVLRMAWRIVTADGITDAEEARFAASMRAKLKLTLEQAVYARQQAEREPIDPRANLSSDDFDIGFDPTE